MDGADTGVRPDAKPNGVERAAAVRVDAARDGDLAAMAALWEEYRGMVVGVCAGVLGRSHLLADAVQEVFLKLLVSVRGVRDGAKLGPWLGTVARNTARDLARHETRRPEPAERPPQPSPLDALIRDEEHRRLLDAVMDLRPEFREVILLRYLHSDSYREIAATLGVPISTVETRLHRARKELAARLRP
jgi:RNA polymerase sigma-70 factor (ECF subfamily)